VAGVELNILDFYSVHLIVSTILDVGTGPFTDANFPRFSSDHFEHIDTIYTYPGIHLRGPSPLSLFCAFKYYPVGVTNGSVYSINSMMNLEVGAFVLLIPCPLFSFMTSSFTELQISIVFLLSFYLYICSQLQQCPHH